MECYKKNDDNSTKTNRFKPYGRREETYNDAGNTSSNGEYNKNRSKNYEENKDQQQTFQSSYAPAAKRLLSRRYPLTKDGRKYIEIGICCKNGVGEVEIALGEVFKKEIILSLSEWNQLMRMESSILDFFQNQTGTLPMYANGVLTIVVGKFNNINVVYFRECNLNCIIIAETSFLTLLKLKDCVSSQCSGLNEVIESIEEKVEIFSNIDDIKNHKDFDKTSLIDNEIVAIYFDK